MADGPEDDDNAWYLCLFGYVKLAHLTETEREQRKRQRSSKTENRTLLAVTMLANDLFTEMNTGKDESLNIAAHKSIARLKVIVKNHGKDDADDNDNPKKKKRRRGRRILRRKFDLICATGPIHGLTKALALLDEIHVFRGEQSRRTETEGIAEREKLLFGVNHKRYYDTHHPGCLITNIHEVNGIIQYTAIEPPFAEGRAVTTSIKKKPKRRRVIVKKEDHEKQ